MHEVVEDRLSRTLRDGSHLLLLLFSTQTDTAVVYTSQKDHTSDTYESSRVTLISYVMKKKEDWIGLDHVFSPEPNFHSCSAIGLLLPRRVNSVALQLRPQATWYLFWTAVFYEVFALPVSQVKLLAECDEPNSDGANSWHTRRYLTVGSLVRHQAYEAPHQRRVIL